MTEPDPRYSGGCVDWTRFEVPALAGFLDEDHGTSWAQVSAWRRAYDLTSAHLDVMRQARETVVRAWPPGTSPAAAAFVDQLDALIASMANMCEAALANERALTGIITVLTEAKRRVDDLHERWKATPAPVLADAQIVAGALSGNVGVEDAGLVGSQQKAALNRQAQQVMRDTDNSAYAYLPQLVVVERVPPPQPYETFTPFDGGTDTGTARSGPSVRRPTIPPAQPPAPIDRSPDDGPALSTYHQPGSGQTVSPEPGLRQPGPGPTEARQPIFAPSPWIETPVGRVLRSGAVLGVPQEVSGNGVDRSPVDRVERSSVQPERSGTGAVAADTEPGLWGTPMGGAATRNDRRGRRLLPPDTEWPVPQGVPPVIEPGPEPVHDPGPGVIGIDR